MTETTVNVGHHPNGNAEAQNLNWIQFNVDYFKTRDGLLKLLELVSKFRCLSLYKHQTHSHEYYQLTIKVAAKISFSLHSCCLLDKPTYIKFTHTRRYFAQSVLIIKIKLKISLCKSRLLINRVNVEKKSFAESNDQHDLFKLLPKMGHIFNAFTSYIVFSDHLYGPCFSSLQGSDAFLPFRGRR